MSAYALRKQTSQIFIGWVMEFLFPVFSNYGFYEEDLVTAFLVAFFCMSGLTDWNKFKCVCG